MTKTHPCISVDGDVWDELQRLFPNQVSTKINDYLHRLRAYSKGDLLNLTKQEIDMKLKKANQKLIKVQSERQDLLIQLQKIKEQEEKKEEEQIEQEKVKALNQTKCAVCGVPKPNEIMHGFPGGMICKGCFIPQNSKRIRQLKLEGGKKDGR